MSILNEKSLKIHLLGVAGSGMSGISYLLSKAGYEVSGCDVKAPDQRDLEKVEIYSDHDVSHAHHADLVVYSTAISRDHIELSEAKRRSVPIAHRSEVLSELMARQKSIAVSGMHGKTSTTGMIAKILLESSMDPTVAVGGYFNFLNANARFGRGPWAVFEADESDGTLLSYYPQIAVVTNLEPEHINYYKNLDDVLNHFKKFLLQVDGPVVLNADDPGCQTLMKLSPESQFMTYGFSEEAQLQAVNIQTQAWSSSFRVLYLGEDLGGFQLNIPGAHQVSNAIAAIAVGISLGIKSEVMAQALSHFESAQRRFQIRGQFNGVSFLDDYAHHPTEIRSTLHAARLCFRGKILGIFQPHRYSRTTYFKKDFAQALKDFDHVVVTDIYPSDEDPIPGVTGRLICEEMIRKGERHVDYIPCLQDLKIYLIKNFAKYDAILTLGAGNITQLPAQVLESLKQTEELGWIRGKILKNESMARHTTFRLGGPADLWIEPSDLQDLVAIQSWARSKGLPFFVIGNGSNIIVRDGGIRGVVVRFSSPSFRKYQIDGEYLTAGAGLSLAEIIQAASDSGLAGLENLKGIPGTIGGALHFNAGAYGSEIGERIHSVLTLNPDGSLETLSASKIEFQYRTSPGLRGKIAIQARFHLTSSDSRKIQERVVKLKGERALRYPKLPNAGCIFKNPEENYAGKLIDEIGLKNLTFGGAQISSRHANFIVNKGQAKASEVLTLIDEVRKKVYQERNVLLENEVEVVGED